MAEHMGRRTFAALLAASLAAPSIAAPAPTLKLLNPPRLKRGDVIGLVAPSGYTTDAAIEKAVTNIESLGYCVKYGANLRATFGQAIAGMGPGVSVSAKTPID